MKTSNASPAAPPKRYGGCATDVIVVRRRDGSLASTSFHVHFGRKWRDRVVEVAVNDIPVPLVMKVNDQGFAMWNSTAAQRLSEDEEEEVLWQGEQPYEAGDENQNNEESEESEEEEEEEEEEVPSEAFIELEDYETSSSSLCSSLSENGGDKRLAVLNNDDSSVGERECNKVTPSPGALPERKERSRSRESQNSRKAHKVKTHPHHVHLPRDAKGGNGCERLLVPVLVDGETSPLRVYAPKDSPSPCTSLDPVVYHLPPHPAAPLSTPYHTDDPADATNSHTSPTELPMGPRQRRAPSPPKNATMLPTSSSLASYGAADRRANSPGVQSGPSSGRRSPAFSPRQTSAVCYEDPIPTHLPSQVELEAMGLTYGENEISFTVLGEKWSATAAVYLWDDTDRLIISDVDGTITKSDLLGHAYAFAGYGAYWIHPGICSLYANIDRNGYHLVYLTARSMHLARSTRKFLLSLEQGRVFLPRGPLFSSPTSFFSALTQEVGRRSHIFKIHCLNDIRQAFSDMSNPFFAAFGNRYSDYVAYTEAGISSRRIYLLDSKSSVKLSGMKFHLTNAGDPSLLDARFPPRRRHGLEEMMFAPPPPAVPPSPPLFPAPPYSGSGTFSSPYPLEGVGSGVPPPHTPSSSPSVTASSSGAYPAGRTRGMSGGPHPSQNGGTSLNSPSRSNAGSPIGRYPVSVSSPSSRLPPPNKANAGTCASFPLASSSNKPTPPLRPAVDLEAEQEFCDHIFWRIDPASLISTPPATKNSVTAGSKDKKQQDKKPHLTVAAPSSSSVGSSSPLTATSTKTLTHQQKKEDVNSPIGQPTGIAKGTTSPDFSSHPSPTSARTDVQMGDTASGSSLEMSASAPAGGTLPAADNTNQPSSSRGRRFFFFGKGNAKKTLPPSSPATT